jgi:hypothetical protein
MGLQGEGDHGSRRRHEPTAKALKTEAVDTIFYLMGAPRENIGMHDVSSRTSALFPRCGREARMSLHINEDDGVTRSVERIDIKQRGEAI